MIHRLLSKPERIDPGRKGFDCSEVVIFRAIVPVEGWQVWETGTYGADIDFDDPKTCQDD